MKHAVIIRLDYPESLDFRKKLRWFQANMLDRLYNQTDQNFEIWIRCHKDHQKLFKQLGCGVFSLPMVKARNGAVKAFSVNHFIDYDIQTRIDYDDIVTLDFIEKIHSEYEPGKVLSFDHHKLDWWSMKQYIRVGEGGKQNYHDQHLSMFVSLMKGWPFIYSRSHTQMWRDADKVQIIPKGYCWHVIHGENTGSDSQITKNDILIS